MTGSREAVWDVVIVGAGVAGLAAWSELDRAGVKALCLEARDRIGGRILTVHDPFSPLPIELGAEFVHGRSPDIWSVIESARLFAYDCAERAVHVKHGRVQHSDDAWQVVSRVMEAMQKAAKNGPDQSFLTFLNATSFPAEAKQLATLYVAGFNAARADEVSIASLAKDAEAADSIDGDHLFRLADGYDSIPHHLLRGVVQWEEKLRLNSVVEAITWQPRVCAVQARSVLTEELSTYRAHRIIITVPLGVLHDDAIRFDPEPVEKLQAAKLLRFGQVIRIILRFDTRIWEAKEPFKSAGFILSDEPVFPTWWTPLPVRAPIITGWSAGPKADALLELKPAEIIKRATEQLARVTGLEVDHVRGSLRKIYSHNWHGDPFARGAYSYVPVGATDQRNILAEPVSDTLYFAGEAAETEGHSATVHGAIAAGRRAARQIIGS